MLHRFRTNSLKIGLSGFAIIIALINIYPFIFMLSSSFKPLGQVFEYPIRIIPKSFIFTNYAVLFDPKQMYMTWYSNTLVMEILTILIKTTTVSITSYAFARLNFKGKNTIFIIFLSALMIPGDVTLVQRYIIYKYLSITDTVWVLVLPAAFDMYFVFLMRQFFMGIPKELTEVAIIDGCSHFKIFYKIMLPLAKPAVLTMILFTFVWAWNDYTNPFIFITDMKKQMLTVGLSMFTILKIDNYAVQMAGASLALIPVILLFFFAQNHFIEGISTTGIKG